MNTLNKLLFAPAIAMAALAIPASAGDDPDIVVTSPDKMGEWKAAMNAKLDRHLIRADGVRGERPMTAIVQVRFSLDEDGKPTDVTTLHHSGARRAERAATIAVSNLRGFEDAPLTNVGDATFQANIVFAPNIAERDRLRAEMARLDRARFAASGARNVIVLGG